MRVDVEENKNKKIYTVYNEYTPHITISSTNSADLWIHLTHSQVKLMMFQMYNSGSGVK